MTVILVILTLAWLTVCFVAIYMGMTRKSHAFTAVGAVFLIAFISILIMTLRESPSSIKASEIQKQMLEEQKAVQDKFKPGDLVSVWRLDVFTEFYQGKEVMARGYFSKEDGMLTLSDKGCNGSDEENFRLSLNVPEQYKDLADNVYVEVVGIVDEKVDNRLNVKTISPLAELDEEDCR